MSTPRSRPIVPAVLPAAVSAKFNATSPDSTGPNPSVVVSSAKAAVEIAIAATVVINTLRIIKTFLIFVILS